MDGPRHLDDVTELRRLGVEIEDTPVGRLERVDLGHPGALRLIERGKRVVQLDVVGVLVLVAPDLPSIVFRALIVAAALESGRFEVASRIDTNPRFCATAVSAWTASACRSPMSPRSRLVIVCGRSCTRAWASRTYRSPTKGEHRLARATCEPTDRTASWGRARSRARTAPSSE